MRTIKEAAVHCSATREGQHVTIDDIRNWHTWPLKMQDGRIRYLGRYYAEISELPLDVQNHWGRGWLDIGYHFVVDLDGILRIGRAIERMGAHVQGHNDDTVGIVYIGGLDYLGKPKDTRTEAQKQTMLVLLEDLVEKHPIEAIKGHRDYSPDIDKDGVIESWEWIKACPCFDAQQEYQYIINNKIR